MSIIHDYSLSTFIALGVSSALYLHYYGRRRAENSNRADRKTTHGKDAVQHSYKDDDEDELSTPKKSNDNIIQWQRIVRDRLDILPHSIQRHLYQSLHLTARHGDDDDDSSQTNVTRPEFHQGEQINPMFRFIQSVHIEQEDSYLQSNGTWITSHGTQEIFTNPASPGFIFEQDVKLLGDGLFFNRLKIHVRDTFVDGKSDVCVDFMNIFPIVRHADLSTMNEGHLEQWMANIPLYPTSFIYQNEGLLVWSQEPLTFTQNGTIVRKLPSTYPDNPKVMVKITDPKSEETAEVEYTFHDSNGLIVAASGVLHPEKHNYPTYESNNIDGEETIRIWERRFLNYQVHHGLLVPTKIEFGWWDEKKKSFQVNVRVSITKIVYTYDDE